MTQERAQEIIKSTYGRTAYALGQSTTTAGEIVIFWIFRGETEDDYRAHVVAES